MEGKDLIEQAWQAGATPSHVPATQCIEGEYTGKKALRNHCGAGLSEVSVDLEGWGIHASCFSTMWPCCACW